MDLSGAARALYALILGLWAGSGLDELLFLTPVARGRLPSLHEAQGLLVSVALARESMAVWVAPALLVALLIGWAPAGGRIQTRLAGVVALGVVALLQSRWFLPEIIELGQALGRRLEHVPADDPLRQRIELFSLVSQGGTILTVGLALFMLFTAVRSLTPVRPGSIQL
ncbi:MAG: hypothetical protein IT384_17935 [Deltaproteobacteria bacterium]|nr:hypothetical protein [Deltaproteobacteria bacterium]